MDRIEKIFALHKILSARRTPVPVTVLQERLHCSRASVYRVAGALERFLGAPVVNVRGSGFRYDPAADAFDLPGLWFNADEIHALLAFHRLLANLGPGLLTAEIEPFRRRIEKLLRSPRMRG